MVITTKPKQTINKKVNKIRNKHKEQNNNIINGKIITKCVIFIYLCMVHVISFKKLRDYFSKETNAKVALQDWYKRTKKAEWESFADLKNTFNSADNVGNNRYEFNIKGNHYRIVAIVLFKIKRVYIRWVGNHKDYSRLKNIDKL